MVVSGQNPSNGSVSRVMVEQSTIGPGEGWSRIIKTGQHLRITDLEGRQAVDFLCYLADDPEEHYNAPNTMKAAGSAYLGEGTALLSSLARPLFTIVHDTVGNHDTIGGCCSQPSNRLLYGIAGERNCRDILLGGLARFRLGPRDMVPNINWFMRVPVAEDGQMCITESDSRAGDFVELRAEYDTIAVLSNCPQVLNPANDFNPTPIRVDVFNDPSS